MTIDGLPETSPSSPEAYNLYVAWPAGGIERRASRHSANVPRRHVLGRTRFQAAG